MQLSKHLTLAQFTKSSTATRLGIKAQFNPPMDVIQNATKWATEIFDPIAEAYYERYGVWVILTSGWRSTELNTKVKGAKTSQHLTGDAGDIEDPSGKNINLLDLVKELMPELPIGQLINEYPDAKTKNPSWVHVSRDHGTPRREFKTLR